MSIFEAVILGIVQGLTEFLPVSSSGHLVLLQRAFGIHEANLFFTVMLHVGTLVAVVAVLYKDIWHLITHPLSEDAVGIFVATLVTGIIYLLFNDIFDASYDGAFLGWGFLYTAGLLYFVTHYRQRHRSRELTKKKAGIIGVFQGLAIFPGVSRSGSTIAGGMLTGMYTEKVARFSFILSIPAIFLGAVKEMSNVSFDSVPWVAVFVGMICAALSGYIAIRFMLAVIKSNKLSVFSMYLVILGVFVLLDRYFMHLVF